MRFCSFTFDGQKHFGFQMRDGTLVDLLGSGKSLQAKGKLSESEAVSLDAVDLKSWLSQGKKAIELAEKIRGWVAAAEPGDRPGLYNQKVVHFLPPIPNPGKIIAIGLNYKEHAAEQNGPLPDRPLVFAKFSTALIASGQPIKLPSISRQVDPEAELCIVMLETGKGFSKEQVGHRIAYMVGNDVSARDIQFSDKQWVRGKSCDTFAPCGPFLVTEDELGDPHDLDIELRVNGEVQQSSNTRHLIFDCYTLVSFVSQSITLETGDIIFTGTPAGVGVFRKPPVFLKPGDVVEVTIEKIGTLTNEVV